MILFVFFRRGGEDGFLDFPPSNNHYRMKYRVPDHGILETIHK